MKNEKQEIIYVGKSKNLKNRVPTYFRTPNPEDKKANKLYRSITDFELILTDTELEALLLESKLIKKYKPWCNRLMKNPEAYTYIKITIDDDIPDIFITHEKDPNDGSLYFGPYPKKGSLEHSVNTLREIYKIKCTKYTRKANSCINYSLGLCNGVCIDKISKQDYRSDILEIVELLSGSSSHLVQRLQYEMERCVSDYQFERAAKFRDQLSSLTVFTTYGKMTRFVQLDSPVFVLEKIAPDSCKVLLLLGNHILWEYSFSPLLNTLETNVLEITKAFLRLTSGKTLPNEISKFDIDEMYILYGYLKNQNNNCRYLIVEETCTEDFLIKEITQFLTDL